MIEVQLQSVLDEENEILARAVGPSNRRTYMREKNIRSDINWHFGLTADDIIRDHIPGAVIGCTGKAKLFCHLAAKRGLDCHVVAMAHLPDWRREHLAMNGILPDNNSIVINGHQIIAVSTPDGLRMFDPRNRRLEFLGGTPTVGSIVDMLGKEYIIKAIVPWARFKKISTYWDLDALYRD